MRSSPRTASSAALAAVVLAVLVSLFAAREAARALPGFAEDGALGLRTNLASIGRLELVCDGDSICGRPLRGLGERWERALPGLRAFEPEFARTPGPGARIVVGDLDDALVARLLAAARLPLRCERGVPHVAERAFEPATFALVCTFADPEREGLPLTIVAGAPRSCARVLEVLQPDCRPSCVVWSDGDRALELDLAPRGGARLQGARDFAAVRTQPLDPADTERLAEVLATRLPAALDAAGRALGRSFAARPSPELIGLGSTEGLLRTGVADVGASFDRFHGRLTALVGPEHEHDAVAAVLAGWLTEELAPPADPWLVEGFAIACVGGLAGDTLEGWAARLRPDDSAALVGASEPLSLDPERSPATGMHHTHGALERRVRHGLSARALMDALDPAALVRVWGAGLATLEPAQRAACEARLAQLVGELPAPDPASPTGAAGRALPARFAGVTLTAPARPDPAGHGTATALDALDQLAELGAEVALVTVHVVVPRTGEVVRSLEGDAALVATLAALRARGIVSVLAVQPITGEHGSGPCDHPKLGSPANWRAAVERQAAAVRHAACLARWGGADVLCIARGAPQFFGVPWRGEGPEPEGHAAVRREKERGWQLAVEAGRSAGVPLVALAPQPGLADGVPVRDALAWVGVDLAPRLVGEGALAPGAEASLAERIGAHLAVGREAVVIGFAAASNTAFGSDRVGGRADVETQRAALAALTAAAAAPSASPRLFLRSWALDGRGHERDEGLGQRPELDADLRRWFAR